MIYWKHMGFVLLDKWDGNRKDHVHVQNKPPCHWPTDCWLIGLSLLPLIYQWTNV